MERPRVLAGHALPRGTLAVLVAAEDGRRSAFFVWPNVSAGGK